MGCTYVHTDSESITEYVKARNRVISLVVGYLLTLLISAYISDVPLNRSMFYSV